MTTRDQLADGLDRIGETLNRVAFEPVIRLGVTGLSRSGKTVFITSLIENLRNRDRLPNVVAVREHRIETAHLQPHPNQLVPRFDFESHLDAMTGKDPIWPVSTRSISQIRLSLRVRPRGVFSGLRRARTVHLDIVDYPGEWLLDLPLISQTYETWSKAAMDVADGLRTAKAKAFLEESEAANPAEAYNEATADRLSSAFTAHLRAAREFGYSALAPGRFLMPGDLEGAPVMAFAPLPPSDRPRGSLAKEMEKRFEAYKTSVVKPFFLAHFSRLDRQVVLLDVLDALDNGPAALADMQTALEDILDVFRVGETTFLSKLFAPRIDKVLFAATKSDHIHHSQHPQLDSLVQALVRRAKDRADYNGAETRSMALASFRSTSEGNHRCGGEDMAMVEGRLAPKGIPGASYPGLIPTDPKDILDEAHSRISEWIDWSFALGRFLPPKGRDATKNGLPHIRLDDAVEFLLGDKL
ncbi:MAG: YcjX family protein [Pseudomonadota bacterium]